MGKLWYSYEDIPKQETSVDSSMVLHPLRCTLFFSFDIVLVNQSSRSKTLMIMGLPEMLGKAELMLVLITASFQL